MKNRTSGASWIALAAVAVVAASCAGKNLDVTPMANVTADAHIGRSLTADSSQVADITDSFAPHETVFAVVDVPDRFKGKTMRVRWVFGSETLGEQSVVVDEALDAYRFRLNPSGGAHRLGSYQFEVTIDGDRVDLERFEVKAG